jgi:hypothetical protein
MIDGFSAAERSNTADARTAAARVVPPGWSYNPAASRNGQQVFVTWVKSSQ